MEHHHFHHKGKSSNLYHRTKWAMASIAMLNSRRVRTDTYIHTSIHTVHIHTLYIHYTYAYTYTVHIHRISIQKSPGLGRRYGLQRHATVDSAGIRLKAHMEQNLKVCLGRSDWKPMGKPLLTPAFWRKYIKIHQNFPKMPVGSEILRQLEAIGNYETLQIPSGKLA